ncbi:MAG TPA: efflux RND transporter periplasmic adaptor subunit [Chitinophagales bacterium]|nr:efflux RND transporter periplasmic adaptor subunit [Chitinophagales bacterium]HRG86965.1 efflux RND transporter periplasmic adaptor subunit [Chitinophagales bacterium]HRH54663.1 efflux RND transporter periplasmic adaptor subunit [Chitinophagales bacterium]
MRASKYILVMIGSGMLIAFAACGEKKSVDQPVVAGPPPAQPVKVIIVGSENMDNSIDATGTVLANEEVEIRSEIQGRVTGVYFKEGESVAAGKLLISIDDRELLSQLKRTELSIQLAKDDESRKKQLAAIGGISKEDYDASLNYLLKLEAELELLNTQIAKTKITAPFSGVIGLRYISEGGYVTPANLIATLQQTHPVKIEFSIPEKYSGNIKNGATVNYTVEGNNKLYTATVYAKEPKIDPATRTIKIRATGPNTNNELIPGAFAKLEINLSTIQDAMILPSEALVPTIKGQSVMLVKNGKATMTVVSTGLRTETTTQIVEGISKGDTVIVTGLLTVRDGMPVKPILSVKSN